VERIPRRAAVRRPQLSLNELSKYAARDRPSVHKDVFERPISNHCTDTRELYLFVFFYLQNRSNK